MTKRETALSAKLWQARLSFYIERANLDKFVLQPGNMKFKAQNEQ
jgi:hypothetical protein